MWIKKETTFSWQFLYKGSFVHEDFVMGFACEICHKRELSVYGNDT